MFPFPWTFRWRSTTAATDPEQPSPEPGTENPTLVPTSSSSPITTPTTPMLTNSIPATSVGLRPSALLNTPWWAVPVHSVLVRRFHNQLGYFHDTGMRIARFVLGSVIDPEAQRVGANGDGVSGVNTQRQGTHDSSRHRWLRFTVKLVVVVGAMALAAIMLRRFGRLPQSRTIYQELLDLVRQIG